MDQYQDDRSDNPYAPPNSDLGGGTTDKETRQWAMILHLSTLAFYAIPLAGVVAPIIIWQLKKDDLPEIDQHGRNVTNWVISSFIYGLIAVPLCLVGVGILMLIVLGALYIIFPIIGGIKANDGIAWKYPLTISIF